MCEKCIALVDRSRRDKVSFACNDCGVDTSPDKGIGEYYMVNDKVWNAVAKKELLCIGCLEKRLGRKLHYGDFFPNGGGYKLNVLMLDSCSKRMLNRMMDEEPALN